MAIEQWIILDKQFPSCLKYNKINIICKDSFHSQSLIIISYYYIIRRIVFIMFRDHCTTSHSMVSTVTVIMYLLLSICLFLVSTPNNLYTASIHNEYYADPGLQVIDHSNQTVNSTHSIMFQYPQQSHTNRYIPQAPSQQLQHRVYNCHDNRNNQVSSSFSTDPAPLIQHHWS